MPTGRARSCVGARPVSERPRQRGCCLVRVYRALGPIWLPDKVQILRDARKATGQSFAEESCVPVAVTNFVPFSFPAGPSRFASGWCEEWQNGLESFLVHWSDEAVWSAAKDASRCLCAGGAPFSGFSQPPCAPPELHRRPSCLIRNPSTFSKPATLRQSSSSSCRLAALRSRAARTWACAVLWISRHAQPTAESRKRLRSPTAYHRCSSPSSAATGVGLLPCVQGDTSVRRGSRRIGGMCVRYIRGSTRKDAWDRSFSVRVR